MMGFARRARGFASSVVLVREPKRETSHVKVERDIFVRESLAPDGDPFARLDRVSRAVMAVMAEEPDFARMVARTAVDRHPAAVKIVRTYLQPLIDLSVTFVRDGQRRGVFADIDPFFF